MVGMSMMCFLNSSNKQLLQLHLQLISISSGECLISCVILKDKITYMTAIVFLITALQRFRMTLKVDKPKESFVMSLVKPFTVGSISGCIATCVIQPIDCIKVMIQSKKQAAGKTKINLSPFTVGKQIIEEEGVLGLYKGLDSALMRQVVYCGIRLGLYRVFEDHVKTHESRTLTFGEKVGYSMLAGLIGSGIANPFDMALIRFQSDSSLPKEERRNYKNVFDALTKMKQELGLPGLWRGSIPTIVRAMAMNSFTLVAYNEVKEILMKKMNETKETTEIRLIGSAIAGISASVGSLPFDNAKTKILKQKKNAQGEYPYKNMIQCMTRTIANEGLTALWVGLPTYYFRVAPHAMISVIVQDYLHDFVDKKKKE